MSDELIPEYGEADFFVNIQPRILFENGERAEIPKCDNCGLEKNMIMFKNYIEFFCFNGCEEEITEIE